MEAVLGVNFILGVNDRIKNERVGGVLRNHLCTENSGGGSLTTGTPSKAKC